MPRKQKWQQPAPSLSRLGGCSSGPTGKVIQFSEEYLILLQRMRDEIFSKGGCVRNTYLSERELLDKIRCARCNGRCNKNAKKENQKPRDRKKKEEGSTAANSAEGKEPEQPKKPTAPLMRCKFHVGRVQNKHWTCCGNHVSHRGCREEEHHIPEKITLAQLTARFQVYPAPQPVDRPFRRAVAIDCEMGTSRDMEPELIRMTMVDYFTSEVLIDSLVWPDVPILHYNTRYSGVTAQQMYEARRKGRCIMGVGKARDLVWNYVSPSTIVVGHSVSNDLKAMRWLHVDIVDSFAIEQEIHLAALRAKEAEEEKRKEEQLANAAVGQASPDDDMTEKEKEKLAEEKKKDAPALKLKTLAKKRLGIDIQVGTQGHDSVEDALAARDLVDWHVRQRMTSASLLPEADVW